MRRRHLLASVAAWPALAWGDAFAQVGPAPVVGWISMASRDTDRHLLAAFSEALAALGWREGQQVVIEARWAEGRIERLPRLAEELSGRHAAVVVAWPTQVVAAMSKAAPRMPIVQVSAADPVTTGFAQSHARPGGMVTGLSNAVTDVTEKLLELMIAAAPDRARIGFLGDSTNFARQRLMEAARRSVTAQPAMEARFAEAGRPEEIEPAIARLAGEMVDSLIVMPSPLLTFERRRIVALAHARAWPVVSGRREWAEEGAILSYGIDVLAQFRRAASYVDRILRGAHPGDLPIEEPIKLELIVNLRAAKTLGVDLPESLLARADEVIE